MKIIKYLICGALFLYVIMLAALYVMQGRMIFKPVQTPPDITQWAETGAQEISVPTRDGLILNAWYWPPEGDKPVILFFHGNTSNIESRAFKAPYYTQNGYGFLLAEYRGYGGNAGAPDERDFYADSLSCMDWLNVHSVKDENIIVYGESLGTGVATYVAANRTVGAVILEAPYTSIEALAQAKYPYVPVALLLKHKFKSLERMRDINTPLLIVHGDVDATIPVIHGRTLYEQAGTQDKKLVILHGGHGDLYDHGAAEAVLGFLDVLKK